MNSEVINKTINIAVEVSDKQCADIMCTALEGGIGYWCCAADIKRTPKDKDENWDYVSFVAYDDEEVLPNNKTSGHIGLVDYATIRRGIARILSGEITIRADLQAQVRTITDEDITDIDSDAADCIVQAGLLNAIVYG